MLLDVLFVFYTSFMGFDFPRRKACFWRRRRKRRSCCCRCSGCGGGRGDTRVISETFWIRDNGKLYNAFSSSSSFFYSSPSFSDSYASFFFHLNLRRLYPFNLSWFSYALLIFLLLFHLLVFLLLLLSPLFLILFPYIDDDDNNNNDHYHYYCCYRWCYNSYYNLISYKTFSYLFLFIFLQLHSFSQ